MPPSLSIQHSPRVTTSFGADCAREEVMENLTGGCACEAIRYKLTASPLIVHACHCRDCQRVTGSAFVVNIWIERKFVETDSPAPKSFRLAGGSGNPHDVFFCGECGVCQQSCESPPVIII